MTADDEAPRARCGEALPSKGVQALILLDMIVHHTFRKWCFSSKRLSLNNLCLFSFGFVNKSVFSNLILAFVSINAFLIFGIGSVFEYLNTGADRSSMLHLELKKASNYIPSVLWSSKINEGRIIDKQSLETIEKDYLKAWYVKHVAYKNNNKR